MSGKIKGKSKIDVYIEYQGKIEQWGGTFQTINPYPKYKKFCKEQMVWDPETEEWVLYYHLHT